MKVWITKYALTTGIEEMSAELCADISPNMIHVRGKPGSMSQCFHGNDWHKTFGAAIGRAEEMRVSKIASLRKSVAKMEKLRFA